MAVVIGEITVEPLGAFRVPVNATPVTVSVPPDNSISPEGIKLNVKNPFASVVVVTPSATAKTVAPAIGPSIP